MSQFARVAGLSQESLYKGLSGDRSPGFDTILKVVEALGLKLHAQVVLTTPKPVAPTPSRSRVRLGSPDPAA